MMIDDDPERPRRSPAACAINDAADALTSQLPLK